MVVLSSEGKAALDKLVVRYSIIRQHMSFVEKLSLVFKAQAIEDPNLPGFVFGVTTAEEEIYFNGGGHRVLNDPSGGDITPDSVFFICSQTKLITHVSPYLLAVRLRLIYLTLFCTACGTSAH